MTEKIQGFYHSTNSIKLLSSNLLLVFQVIEGWNKTELDSYLIEISANILQFKDEKGEYLVEKIRDTAGQVN